MQSIYNAIGAFVGWYWGIPILIILIGGGIALTAIIGGVQFSRLGFIFKHTLGTIFNKEEQARKKAAGITPLEATIVALGGTVGTGNIVGVGAAIAAGGPGALFWMWVCGFGRGTNAGLVPASISAKLPAMARPMFSSEYAAFLCSGYMKRS